MEWFDIVCLYVDWLPPLGVWVVYDVMFSEYRIHGLLRVGVAQNMNVQWSIGRCIEKQSFQSHLPRFVECLCCLFIVGTSQQREQDMKGW
jgi:hypothetical protein